jgi:hypothetical protein
MIRAMVASVIFAAIMAESFNMAATLLVAR